MLIRQELSVFHHMDPFQKGWVERYLVSTILRSLCFCNSLRQGPNLPAIVGGTGIRRRLRLFLLIRKEAI